MLIGEQDAGGVSLMESAGFAFGCLQPAVLEELITRAALIEVNDFWPAALLPTPLPLLCQFCLCRSIFTHRVHCKSHCLCSADKY